MPSFDQHVSELFQRNYERLARVVARMSGEPDLAADVVQEAFVRLHQRGALPDAPESWLVTVSLNLFRNARTTHARRGRLLTVDRGRAVHSDPAPAADVSATSDDARSRVRRALDELPERERQLLLLRAEGFSYRELAAALAINEASVGTLLARAKDLFRDGYSKGHHASDD